MRELSKSECEQVSGGIIPVIGALGWAAAGAVSGFIQYGYRQSNRGESMTLGGALVAIGFGAFTSGFGAGAKAALGGGALAWALVVPKEQAVNYIGQQVAHTVSHSSEEAGG
ncbi:MAG: class IIb bacteriocin, lactobin A/cerein 7B family [Pseudomonadota bacterium]